MEIALEEALGIIVLGDCFQYYELFQRIAINPYIDRLYRRYVRQEEVKNTLVALDDCMSNASKLDKHMISKLKDALIRGDEASKLCIEDYGKYIPVHIVLSDEPYYLISHCNIPLEDYDNNDGEPFWMRPEYIIEKYSKVKKS